MVVAGLDGCRAGWVMATLTPGDAAQRAPGLAVSVIPRLADVAPLLADGRLVAAGIDIPIGLPERAPRACDVEARRLLGPRRSSVFPAPVRAVLATSSYEDACAASRAGSGKAISRQLFNIVPKIREADDVLRQAPTLARSLFEMSPELSFTVLAGAPMASNKRTAEGRAQRLAALRVAFGEAAGRLAREPPPAGAARDDVLDALVGAWTASRRVAGAHLALGGELDERGLRMEIVA